MVGLPAVREINNMVHLVKWLWTGPYADDGFSSTLSDAYKHLTDCTVP
jgi:hypothetical protein